MNRSQVIALAIGAIWAIATVMRPPVFVPAGDAPGAARSFVELSQWNSAAVHQRGVDVGYFVGEIVAISALTAALVFFLKTQPTRGGQRRR